MRISEKIPIRNLGFWYCRGFSNFLTYTLGVLINCNTTYRYTVHEYLHKTVALNILYKYLISYNYNSRKYRSVQACKILLRARDIRGLWPTRLKVPLRRRYDLRIISSLTPSLKNVSSLDSPLNFHYGQWSDVIKNKKTKLSHTNVS